MYGLWIIPKFDINKRQKMSTDCTCTSKINRAVYKVKSDNERQKVKNLNKRNSGPSLKTCERTRRVLPHCAARETLSAMPLTKLKF